jgi:hypothetical protein
MVLDPRRANSAAATEVENGCRDVRRRLHPDRDHHPRSEQGHPQLAVPGQQRGHQRLAVSCIG